MVAADNRFGLELFKQISDTGIAIKNLMISPLTVSMALSMTYNGVKNQTKEAFNNTLHFDGLTSEEINQSSKDLIGALLSVDSKVTLDIANHPFVFIIKEKYTHAILFIGVVANPNLSGEE